MEGEGGIVCYGKSERWCKRLKGAKRAYSDKETKRHFCCGHPSVGASNGKIDTSVVFGKVTQQNRLLIF